MELEERTLVELAKNQYFRQWVTRAVQVRVNDGDAQLRQLVYGIQEKAHYYQPRSFDSGQYQPRSFDSGGEYGQQGYSQQQQPPQQPQPQQPQQPQQQVYSPVQNGVYPQGYAQYASNGTYAPVQQLPSHGQQQVYNQGAQAYAQGTQGMANSANGYSGQYTQQQQVQMQQQQQMMQMQQQMPQQMQQVPQQMQQVPQQMQSQQMQSQVPQQQVFYSPSTATPPQQQGVYVQQYSPQQQAVYAPYSQDQAQNQQAPQQSNQPSPSQAYASGSGQNGNQNAKYNGNVASYSQQYTYGQNAQFGPDSPAPAGASYPEEYEREDGSETYEQGEAYDGPSEESPPEEKEEAPVVEKRTLHKDPPRPRGGKGVAAAALQDLLGGARAPREKKEKKKKEETKEDKKKEEEVEAEKYVRVGEKERAEFSSLTAAALQRCSDAAFHLEGERIYAVGPRSALDRGWPLLEAWVRPSVPAEFACTVLNSGFMVGSRERTWEKACGALVEQLVRAPPDTVLGQALLQVAAERCSEADRGRMATILAMHPNTLSQEGGKIAAAIAEAMGGVVQ